MATYEPVLLARVNKPNSGKLEGYRADGGYSTFERVLKQKKPPHVVSPATGGAGSAGVNAPWSRKPVCSVPGSTQRPSAS